MRSRAIAASCVLLVRKLRTWKAAESDRHVVVGFAPHVIMECLRQKNLLIVFGIHKDTQTLTPIKATSNGRIWGGAGEFLSMRWSEKH